MIGTVVPPLINSGIAEQVQGMSDECHESGYSMLLVQGEFTAARPRRRRSARCSAGGRPGMILQSFVQSDAARALLVDAAACRWSRSPRSRGATPIDMAVGVSNFETAYAMTMHLARKGYKRIGFVSTPIHGNDRLQQRRTGYHAALTELGIAQPADMEVEVPITAQGGAEALVDADRPAQGHRRDLLLERHAGGRRGPGMPPPRLGGPGPHRDRRLRRHGPRRAALPAAHHGAGRPLRDGPARGAPAAARGSRGDTKVPTITSLGFEIVDRESA